MKIGNKIKKLNFVSYHCILYDHIQFQLHNSVQSIIWNTFINTYSMNDVIIEVAVNVINYENWEINNYKI